MQKTQSYELYSPEYFMNEALKEARKALEKDEVPIGAVIVCQDKIIARAHNLTETLNDVTAHCEMQAITSASDHLGGKYLIDCILYVTLEPCVMCAGAIFWAQAGKLVFGAEDKKRGYRLLQKPVLHPKTIVESGILEKECASMITEFFVNKRK
jgi:tRNA(adenine34) deaminase